MWSQLRLEFRCKIQVHPRGLVPEESPCDYMCSPLVCADLQSPYHAARVNVSRSMPFSARALKKNIFFDVDIVVKKKQIEMWIIVVCTLIDNVYVSLLASQTFFCIVSAY